MRTIFLTLFTVLAFVIIMPTISNSQTWYMDPGTHPMPFYCPKDSISSTDSSFAQFVPPTSMYYIGFSEISRTGGIGTFRFVKCSSTTTALDSLVTTAVGIGTNTGLTSARAGTLHTLLIAGTAYRVEYISTLNQAFLKPSVTLWFELR
ncbi:MAG: hypothetical protein ABR936_11905 [Bacteroidota bacterium]|jgi:hypothetical protein